jgi:hypothetical protein
MKLYRNGIVVFEHMGPNWELVEDHFGLRAKGNHETIDNFKIWQITKGLR